LRPAGDEDVLAVEIVFDILGVEVLVAAHVHARDVTLGASVASAEGAFTDRSNENRNSQRRTAEVVAGPPPTSDWRDQATRFPPC
jgi:hypothetical protein